MSGQFYLMFDRDHYAGDKSNVSVAGRTITDKQNHAVVYDAASDQTYVATAIVAEPHNYNGYDGHICHGRFDSGKLVFFEVPRNGDEIVIHLAILDGAGLKTATNIVREKRIPSEADLERRGFSDSEIDRTLAAYRAYADSKKRGSGFPIPKLPRRPSRTAVSGKASMG